MKNFFSSLFFSLIIVNGYAQQPPIMVCNAAGTTCNPYTSLDTAVTAAIAGSYIYAPGGNFALNVSINKELHLIGAGHYHDSTLYTGVTQITGSIILDTGCHNTSIEGFYIVGQIHHAPSIADTINNIQITRSNFATFYGLSVADNRICNSCLIKDCISREDLKPGFLNSDILNCVINGNILAVKHSTISNNVIFGSITYNSPPFLSTYALCTNNTVENNIFDSLQNYGTGTGTASCFNCVLNNNLTIYSSLVMSSVTSQLATITNVPVSNLFLMGVTKGFDYTKDFHLKSSCPGHNAGADGTDVGIYGSSLPYPASAVPSNPHFFYKNVNGTTDAAGNLPVQFKVRATH